MGKEATPAAGHLGVFCADDAKVVEQKEAPLELQGGQNETALGSYGCGNRTAGVSSDGWGLRREWTRRGSAG